MRNGGSGETGADYVVVGAGSAGCVLANRLTADGTSTVILVEAGGPDRKAEISVPAAYPMLFGTAADWAFDTVPQPALAGRSLYWPRGRTLGGSSSINAQIWTRGHRADYDGWATAGATGWSASDVLPYFARAEDRDPDPGSPPGYGIGGPIRVEDLREQHPSTGAFLEACAQAGLAPMGAGEAVAPEGYGPIRVTQRGGRRWSAADGYLRPAAGRPNLVTVTGALVRRVVLDGDRAVGVEVETAAGIRRIQAGREVILAAGAVGSPHLLGLSGIGDPDHLRALGIPVVVGSPAVGRNLADHLHVPLVFTARVPVSPGVGPVADDLRDFVGGRRGRLTSNLAEAIAFVRTDDRLAAPDVELLWMLVPFLDHGRGVRADGVTVAVVVLQPASRGEVRLASADPAAKPMIDPRYLSDPAGADLATAVAGVALARKIAAAPALSGWLGEPSQPGVMDAAGPELAGFVRRHAQTLYHPVGTCRLGSDDGSVVDLEFKVRGVDGLRVVDASVMPTVPRAHTHAPTVMLAERAADAIRGPGAAERPVAAATTS